MSGIDIVVGTDLFMTLPYWQVMETVGVPPHVSILYPWRDSPLAASDIDDVTSVIGPRKPFSIVFDAVAAFENGTVCARLAPSTPLTVLMTDVWGGFPDTPPYEGEFAVPVPHLTLAKPALENIAETVAALKAELGPHLPIQWDVDHITILEQSPDDMWRTAGTVRLAID